MAKVIRERDVERYLVKQVRARKGEVRKVRWAGRRHAPDRRVMLPGRAPFWLELKAPREKPRLGQLREIGRMRALGETVYVADSFDDIDNYLS